MKKILKTRKFTFLSALSFLVSPLVFAQNDLLVEEVFAPVQLDDDWQVADVNFASLDRAAIEQLTADIDSGQFRNIHSVLVAHKEHLVYEYYWTRSGHDLEESRNRGREEMHVLNSVTKSVTSLLLGVALESNFKDALQQPVFEFFPDYQSRDSTAKTISLENVLTMSAGFLWNEMDVSYTDYTNDDNQLQKSNDPISFILSRPVRDTPGSRWYYNGGLTMVAAGVLDRLIDKSMIEFARQELFEPLHITKIAWSGQWPNSRLVNAAWGLRMRARDLLKIGSLVLNQGQWKGKQVVPGKWIELSTHRLREDLRTWSADGLYGYGYQWWHGRHVSSAQNFEAITALGYGGQRIFILPEQKLVITVFAANYDGDWLIPEAILNRIVAAQEL